jgi:hypothetical protein
MLIAKRRSEQQKRFPGGESILIGKASQVAGVALRGASKALIDGAQVRPACAIAQSDRNHIYLYLEGTNECAILHPCPEGVSSGKS